MKVRIGDLKPNPFRYTERYPIDKEKVAALRESYRTTTFWENLIGRQINDEIQIAFGHYPQAFRRRHDPDDGARELEGDGQQRRRRA